MAAKKTMSRTKDKVGEVISQAKASLKILEMLEKETLAKAKGFVKNPANAKQLTNEKFLGGLKKIGVASERDIQALRARVEQLEADVAQLKARASGAAALIKE
ncbi:MAG: hypothetical protein NDJ90_12955 [Oligoflexia bacterium]|nr:hypothetical protein [Oligoflexia bacterium]